MRCIAVCGGLLLVLACSFDATGLGETPGAAVTVTGVATTETGEPPAPTSTGAPIPETDGSTGVTDGGSSTTGAVDPSTGAPDPTTGTSTTIDPTTTTATTDATTTTGPPDETTGEPDQTTGPPPCEGPGKHIMHAVDATVAAPMGKHESAQPGVGTIVYSEEAEKGTADFAVTLACAGEVAVWGRVFDPYPGQFQNDPDSFHFRVDGGPEQTWFYGCQTGGKDGGKYHWLRMNGKEQNAACDQAAPFTPMLSAGTHNFMMRNREAKNQADAVAAISRLLITDDLGYVPGDDD